MIEVAKVREALEWMKKSGRLKAFAPTERALRDSFLAHGLKMCDRYDATMWDKFSERNMELIAAILRDAGLMEGR